MIVLIIGAVMFGASFFVNYVLLLLKILLIPVKLVLPRLFVARPGKAESPSNTVAPSPPPVPPTQSPPDNQ